MKKRVIISLIILVLITIILIIATKILKLKNKKEDVVQPINYEEENNNQNETENDKEKINKMITEQGFKADENIYEIGKEYDGREVVIVKSGIQYKVALAGALKKSIPEFNEVNELLSKAPTHTGIWIEENSREKFLNIIKNITNANYTINESGYLIQTENWKMNKYDKKIQKMLSEEKLYVFDICSKTYLVDDVTGEIQEYPFEEMDPYSGYEYFESDNKEMFIMSENISGKINPEDILKEILD